MRLAFVWGSYQIPQPDALEMAQGVTIGTQPLAHLMGADWLTLDQACARGKDYDALLINQFPSERAVSLLAKLGRPPLLYMIPDSPPEVFIQFYVADWLRELRTADGVLACDKAHRTFCAGLVDSPVMALPLAIGSPAAFAAARRLEKRDPPFVVASGHRSIDESLMTLAALAVVQRRTGVGVVFIGGHTEKLRQRAEGMGLEAEWLPYCAPSQYIQIVARARLMIDLYPAHVVGRTQITAAYAGTPVLHADTTEAACGEAFGICDLDGVATRAEAILAMTPDEYGAVRARGAAQVEREYGYNAVRAKLNDLREAIRLHMEAH